MAETIGIIGAGNVGAALGRRLTASGYAVHFGVRDPKKIDELVSDLEGASAGSPAEVAAARDVVFLTVPGQVAADIAASLGDLGDTVIVDCTNPLTWDAGPVWNPPAEGSNAAAIAARCGAAVVKAFNTFGAELHADPALAGDARAEVPMAGDSGEAKERVATIAKRCGFAPIDAGPLRNAAVLENHAILWIHLAIVGGRGRQWAYNAAGRG